MYQSNMNPYMIDKFGREYVRRRKEDLEGDKGNWGKYTLINFCCLLAIIGGVALFITLG